MDSELNPYAAPSAELARPPETQIRSLGPVRFWFAEVFAAVLIAGSVPASAFALWDVETIVGSGAVFTPVSLVLIFLALPRVLRPLILVALTMLLIVAGCILTISWNSWSPSDAQQPIGYATIGCAALMQLGWLLMAISVVRYRRLPAPTV